MSGRGYNFFGKQSTQGTKPSEQEKSPKLVISTNTTARIEGRFWTLRPTDNGWVMTKTDPYLSMPHMAISRAGGELDELILILTEAKRIQQIPPSTVERQL